MPTKKRKPFPVKTAQMTVDGEDYVVRTNLPMRTFADIQSGDYDRTIAALREIVVEHPWGDDDAPLDVAEWPDEVAGAVIKEWGGILKAVPPA